MSVFCLRLLSGFLWLSVRGFPWLGCPPPASAPRPLCSGHAGRFLIPEQAKPFPSPTLTLPSAWNHLPCSLGAGSFSLQMLPPWWGLPSHSLFQHPVYFLHIIWLLWWLVYCLSPLLGMGASQDTDLAVWVAAVGSVKMLWWAPGWMGAVGLSAGGVTCRDLVSPAHLS